MKVLAGVFVFVVGGVTGWFVHHVDKPAQNAPQVISGENERGKAGIERGKAGIERGKAGIEQDPIMEIPDAKPLTLNEEKAWRAVAESAGGPELYPPEASKYFPRYVLPLLRGEYGKALALKDGGKSEFAYKVPRVDEAGLVRLLTKDDRRRFFSAARIVGSPDTYTQTEREYAAENLRMLIRRPIQGQKAYAGVMGMEYYAWE